MTEPLTIRCRKSVKNWRLSSTFSGRITGDRSVDAIEVIRRIILNLNAALASWVPFTFRLLLLEQLPEPALRPELDLGRVVLRLANLALLAHARISPLTGGLRMQQGTTSCARSLHDRWNHRRDWRHTNT